MKKLVSVLVLIMSLSFVLVSFAEEDIKVYVNNEGGLYSKVNFDVTPQIIDGRTLVPLRAIFESLGATVEWDGSTGTITGKKGNTTLVLYLNKREAKLNDKDIWLDAAPISINGRTLVPTRVVGESLGMHVSWDGNNRTIKISPNDIIEWRYEGYEGTEPYKEYEQKYVDGVKVKETRYTGKNHEIKKVTLYSVDGRTIENVPENKISSYGSGWYTTPPKRDGYFIFRKVNWGMSKQQVIDAEGKKPDIDQGNYISYNLSINVMDCDVLYVLNDTNQLCGIAINPSIKHSNPNEYINDYNSFKNILVQKFGTQTNTDDMLWKGDLYKGDVDHYGMAVATGDLQYTSTWKNEDSEIYNMLKGDNYKIKLSIIYQSKKFPQPAIDNGM